MSVTEQEGRYIIALIRSFLTGEKLAEEGVHDWKEFYRQTCRHQLVALVHDALRKNGIALPKEIDGRLQEKYWKAISKDTVFQHEYECIEQAFLEKGIHMMPLKGCLLKHYYPETFYRSMSDMDILVRQEDRASVRECMEKMGYETECFGKECHDVYMKPPVTNVEIHHVLFEEEHSIYRDFFRKIREGINGDEAGVYAMSKEDTYLYLLAHLAKHLKNGGAGIRQILDIWLYLQKEDDGLDKAYLRESLKTLELEKLHTSIKELGEYWMHPPVEQSKRMEQLTDFIINNGIYGTKENSFTNRVLRADESENLNLKKRRVIWSIFFPAWKDLCAAYPFLKKWPVLFPFVQIKRACKFIFFKSGKDYVRTVANVKEDKAEALKNSMDELGIR